MNKWFEEVKEWWALYSVRLAAAVAALFGYVAADPNILFSVISFIPVDPVARAVFAVAVAVVTFLAPLVARMWPQDTDK